MTKLTARILLICIILALAVMACVNGGDGNSSSTNSSSTDIPGSNVSPYGPDATATFGAEQFQIQLTAIANPSP